MFDLELSGKIALITGGSDGLGRATAERFIEEGANVAICGRPSEYAKSVAAEIFSAAKVNNHNTSGTITAFGADITNTLGCETLVNDTVSEFDGIDI